MEAKVVRWDDDLAVRLSADEVRQFGLEEGQVVEICPALPQPMASGGDASSPRRRSTNGLPLYTLEETIAEARRLGPDFEPRSIDRDADCGSEVIDDEDPRRSDASRRRNCSLSISTRPRERNGGDVAQPWSRPEIMRP